MTSRRTVLRTGALVAAATAAVAASGGCGADGRRIQVVVVWSGNELAQFRRVVGGYRPRVNVVSAGDNIDAFLRARQLTGARPDVAVLPRPGLVVEYARRGWLSPLDDRIADRFPSVLKKLLRHEGKVYGAWVKAAHKSRFWHLPSVLDDVLPAEPTWAELTRTVRELADPGDRTGLAPLAIGAADGWVLTDWFEHVLAAIEPPGFSDRLARSKAEWTDQPVLDTLDLLADLWSIRGAFPGGGQRALLTQFDESVIQVVTGRAAMVFGADFVAAFAAPFPGGEELTTFRFPKAKVRGTSPLVVGGDAAVVLGGSQAGHDLVDRLAQPATFAPWISSGGFLSPHLKQNVLDFDYPAGLERELAEELHAEADKLRFDLSDRLPGAFTGADGVGIWRILQEFFADVTTPGPGAAGAVRRTSRRLDQAARDARRDGGGW